MLQLLIILKAVEKALAVLKDLGDSPNLASELSSHDEVLLPLVLASGSAAARVSAPTPKMVGIAVGCLHRLIIHTAISEGQIESVFAILRETINGADEVQLKALQCMMPLLSHYPFIHQENLVKAYQLCLQLHDSRSPTVTNAAVAIIRQLIIWLFEKVAEEDQVSATNADVVVKTDDGRSIGMQPAAADAFIIFQDICLLTNDERPLVLGLGSISKSFGLELVESVLAYHASIFRKHPEYVRVLKEKICTMAVKRFTEKCDFAQACRLWRVIGILIREFSKILMIECEIFVSFCVRFLDDENSQVWEKALVLEVVRDILGDPGLMSLLFQLDDKEERQGPRVFRGLFAALSTLIISSLSQRTPPTEISMSQSDMRVQCLNQFDKSTPPAIPQRYLLLLSYLAISQWLGGVLAGFKMSSPRKLLVSGIERYALVGELSRIGRMAKEILEDRWGQVHKALLVMLTANIDSDWRQELAVAIRNFGCLLGLFEMHAALNSTIQSLLELGLAEMQSATLVISETNVTVSQLLLQLALSIDDLIQDSWIHIIKVMHGIDLFSVFRAKKVTHETLPSPTGASGAKKLSSPALLPVVASPSPLELDRLAQLTELSRSLVENSKYLDSGSFVCFLRALCQLSLETMTLDAGLHGKMTVMLYPVQKIKQVALLNVSRYVDPADSVAWDLLMNQLTTVLSSPDVSLRGLGAEAFSLLLNQFAATVDPQLFSQSETLQRRIVGSLMGIVELAPDIEKMALESLYRLIQGVGQHLSYGWPLVFDILHKVLCRQRDPSARGVKTILSILRPSFSCIKLICSDFLAILDGAGLKQCIEILGQFAKQTDDLNIGLTAIGLLWDVSDYIRLKRLSESDGFELWILIMKHLSMFSVDARPELRNSAIQTAFRTIEIYMAALRVDDWEVLFETIVIPLMQAVPSAASQTENKAAEQDLSVLVHHSRNSVDKQWDETQMFMLQGLGQVYRGAGLKLMGLENFKQYWERLLGTLVLFCAGGRIELVSVAVACFSLLVQDQVALASGMHFAVYWEMAWKCWNQIGQQMTESVSFTQETLITFVKMFGPLMALQGGKESAEWLRSSLAVIDLTLQCETPSDPVRDTESVSPLERVAIQQIELIIKDTVSDNRSLYLEHYCGWLGWPRMLRNIKMTRIPSIRRMRMATNNSSYASSPGSDSGKKPANIKTGQATFVAMASEVMGTVCQRFVEWHQDLCIYQSGIFLLMIKALGRFMVLKYKAPSRAGGEASWRLATLAFNEIVAASVSVLIRCEDDQLRQSCWTEIVHVMEGSMESNRLMVPKLLALDQLDSDEAFDIAQVKFVRQVLLPAMSGVAAGTVRRLLLAIDASSRLYFSQSDLHDDKESAFLSPDEGGQSDTVPVIKEKLAVTCLQCLFEICSERQTASGLPEEITRICLPILLERCRGVIVKFVEDKALLGRMPFPRVRQDEMVFVVQALADLRIPSPNRRAVVSDGLMPPNDFRRMLLATSVGHLFYLYPELCLCLTSIGADSGEGQIVPLVHRCFVLMGSQLGLTGDEYQQAGLVIR